MALRFRTIALAGTLCILAGILCYRTATGQMALYIHPRYELLVYGCALFLVCFAAVQWNAPTAPAPFGLTFTLIPVCIAVAIAPKPLGAAALATQLDSLNTVVQAASSTTPDSDTRSWDLYDWAVASSVDIRPHAGAPAVIEGFVVVNPELELPSNQLMVARYVLKCCTADAGGVGMRVVWAGAAGIRSDSWVRVVGTIQVESDSGVPRPLLVADSVSPIEQPARPYLVP